MAILSKGCKPENFESQNSKIKLSFTNVGGLRSDFVECESFLESSFPDILTLYETHLDDSIDYGNYSFNPKGSRYSIYGLASLSEGRASFCTGRIFKKICGFLLMFSTGFTSFSVLLFFLLITFSVFMHGFWFYFIYNRWGSLDRPICYFVFFLIGIHSMQGWTATTRHGVTKKEAQKD